MDLTFQVPMQYFFLQHRTLLLSAITSTAGYCFYFGSIPSFFLITLNQHQLPVGLLALHQDGGHPKGGIFKQCLLFLFVTLAWSFLSWTTASPLAKCER